MEKKMIEEIQKKESLTKTLLKQNDIFKKIRNWGITETSAYILLLGPTFCSKAIALSAIEEAKKWLRENDLKPEDVFF